MQVISCTPQANSPYGPWTPVASIATDVHNVRTMPKMKTALALSGKKHVRLYIPITVIPSGYVFLCVTWKRPDSFIHRIMQVCVEYASSAPPIIQNPVNIQLRPYISSKFAKWPKGALLQVWRQKHLFDQRNADIVAFGVLWRQSAKCEFSFMGLQIKRLCCFWEIRKENESKDGYRYRDYTADDERLLMLDSATGFSLDGDTYPSPSG